MEVQLSETGKRLIGALEEAVSIAKGEQPAARITMQGQSYVPEQRLKDAHAALAEIRDGLRADWRVWLLQPDGTRVEGPSLREFIDAALSPISP